MNNLNMMLKIEVAIKINKNACYTTYSLLTKDLKFENILKMCTLGLYR